LHRRFVDCYPGGCRGNTERVVAQWRRPVASGVALDILRFKASTWPSKRPAATEVQSFVAAAYFAWLNRS
jgi:hypothetical protein